MDKKWYLIDAEGKTLGRLATEVSKLLMGKHKPTYAPHTDEGDFVIIVNAEKVVVSGNKFADKEYKSYSGYPGGLKITSYKNMIAKRPTFPIENAVKGMLPKNSRGRAMLKKLRVYAGPDHKNQAQMPQVYEF